MRREGGRFGFGYRHASNSGGKKKLSYLEAREFAGIEAAVEAAEEQLQRARHTLEDPAVAVDAVRLTAAWRRWRRRRRRRTGSTRGGPS